MLILFASVEAAAVARRGRALSSAQRTRLRELFTAHADLVWRLLRRHRLTVAQADDGLQQVFLVALDRLDAITPEGARAFLCSTAVLVARRAGTWREDLPGELPEAPSLERPDDELERTRRRALLQLLLGQLEEDLRLVLVLQDIEGLSKREAAEVLGIPEGTVASRTRRAREAFRALLDHHLEGAP